MPKCLTKRIGMVSTLVLVAAIFTGCTSANVTSRIQSGNDKPIRIGTGTVRVEGNAETFGAMNAVMFMEMECAKKGIATLSRRQYEDKVRTILKEQNVKSIQLTYMDDGTTSTITQNLEP